MNCEECKRNEEQKPAQVPYFVHEAEMYRWERESQRMRILVYITLAATVFTNAAWILHLYGVF